MSNAILRKKAQAAVMAYLKQELIDNRDDMVEVGMNPEDIKNLLEGGDFVNTIVGDYISRPVQEELEEYWSQNWNR